MKRVLMFAGALSVGLLASASLQAASIDDILGDSSFQATISVACGDLEKDNCAKVLPRIAQKTVPNGLSITAFNTRGSVESAVRLVRQADKVQAAVGQRDAFDTIAATTDGAGQFKVVGRAVYPYYAYLVVAASNRADDLADMIKRVEKNKFINIAAGGPGSGGNVTLSKIRKHSPGWDLVLTVDNDNRKNSLARITAGQLDGFFIMDGPGSDVIDEIKAAVDPQTKKPLFKLIGVNPPNDFYRTKDWNGGAMYSKSEIVVSGWSSNIKTLSVDAIVIIGTRYAQANGRVETLLREALDGSAPAIRADLSVPKDWVPLR